MATPQLIVSGSLLRLENALFERVRRQKQDDPLRPVVVVCGSAFLGHHLSRELARNGNAHGCVSFLTLNDVARTLTRRALLGGDLHPVPEGGKELIARKLLHGLDQQSYFSSVKDQPHLPQVLAATLTDIEDSCLDFEGAARGTRLKPAARKKVIELVRLHRQYRAALDPRLLTEAGLLALAAARAPGFAAQFGCDSLLVYGFYELTGAQRQFLQALAVHVDVTAFLLAEDGGRLRASAPLRNWWNALRATEDVLPREELAGDLAALQARVFSGLDAAREDDGSVRVLSCANEVAEAREIAREAIRLRQQLAIPFQEIAVLVRDTATYLPLLTGVFQQIGLPFYIREGLPLHCTAAGRSVLAALRLPQNDYARAEVMQWLTLGAVDAGSLTDDRTEAPLSLWDRISGDAGIVQGEAQWRRRLQNRLEAFPGELATASAERRPALQYSQAQTEQLLRFMDRLFSIGAAWRRQKNWAALAESVSDFLVRFHPAGPERDQVRDAILSLRALDCIREPATLPLFTDALENALAGVSRKSGALHQTGVHLLSLATARHTRFRVVFVPGLTEGSFPLPGRQDPILLDEEREALSFGNRALPLKSHRPREERLLFMLALEAARERLILSLPRADVASGAEKIPSYFLLQSLECLAGWQLSYTDLHSADAALDRVLHVGGSQLLARDHRSAIDRREFDLGAIGACLDSEYPVRARYLEALSPKFARAVQAEQAQWGAAELTVYDGALDTFECRSALAGMFAPHRVYSATALERYAACPYRFFLTDVLRLRELEDPVAIDELGARDKGDLMHVILREFYEAMKAERKLPLVGRYLPAYRDALAAICERHFRRVEREGLAGFPNAWAFRQRFIIQDLERHLRSEIDRGKKDAAGWIPEAFEQEFGGALSPPVEAPAVSENVRLRGQIDRLDLSADHKAVRVVDYKSGRKRFNQTVGLHGGSALQLPLYLLAARNMQPSLDLAQSSAEYCYITRRGRWGTCAFPGSSLTSRQPELARILQTIVDGCRQGLFPQSPDRDACANCEYARVGDPRRDALAKRKQDDPRLQAFRQMREIP